jgi:hypothetical protein
MTESVHPSSGNKLEASVRDCVLVFRRRGARVDERGKLRWAMTTRSCDRHQIVRATLPEYHKMSRNLERCRNVWRGGIALGSDNYRQYRGLIDKCLMWKRVAGANIAESDFGMCFGGVWLHGRQVAWELM